MTRPSAETNIDINRDSQTVSACEGIIERARIRYDPLYDPKSKKRELSLDDLKQAALANRRRNGGALKLD